ncbi:DUF1571 domain-containing protein [Paraburkholderia jirisanensis]
MPPSTTAPRRLYRKHSLRLVVCWAALSALAAAHAQDDEAAAAGKTASAAAASAAASAALPAAGSSAKADNGAPLVAPSEAGKLKPDEQVRWLRRAAQSGLLEKLSDEELTTLFQSLDPLTVPRYVKDGPNGYPSYEFTMLRQERIRGSWPSRPDHMLVRVTRDPIRIYAKWLPDGAHAGQEVIYDEARRPDEMYGHLGGFLRILPLWASLNGSLARTQSNHSIRDLGTEYIATQFLSEGEKYAQAGVTRPTKIEAITLEGVRVVAFTYETHTGMPAFYAKRETLGLDLRHPYFRTVESYDNDGNIFERIVFQTITPKTFDDETFDPQNPAYKF